jgi:broad specificity phosphatase PhoE
MSRTLVLVRHGRTPWNAESRSQGQTDIELDETGLAQAEEVAAALVPLAPALLWTSDLVRARRTAAAIGAACGLDPVPDPRLREYDVGVRSGLTDTEFAERFPAEYAAWAAGVDGPVVPGEESAADVGARTSDALRDLLDALAPDGTGVAVMHGACIKVALGKLLAWPHARSALVGLDNGAVVIIRERRYGLRLSAYNLPPAGLAAACAPDFASRRADR